MFTSYAQNFEDVILWRALKHIENGFYIDVGAQDPVVESVSRAFYENGWRGIHAEATTYYAEKVRQDRPDEMTVQAAIGDGDGHIRFFEIPETGLSTSDQEIATKHRVAGHTVVETDVPLMPLSALLKLAGGRDIHWLKVDVEGMEASVIESWSPSTARPWIVVMESTLPNSQETNFDAWESKLISLGYRYAYFDGLSRFYVSEQHPELLQHFGPGPNVFDGFVLAEKTPYTAVLRSMLDGRFRRIEELQRIVQQDEERLRNLEEALRETNKQLHQIRRSISWRLTFPFHYVEGFLRRTIKSPRHYLRAFLRRLIRWLSRKPQLKEKCLRLLHRFPGVRNRLERFARSQGYGGGLSQLDGDQERSWYIDAPQGATASWNVLIQDIRSSK